MELPQRFPFTAYMTYNGKPLTPIDDVYKESLLELDPHFEERRKVKTEALNKFLHPFALFLHKYPILRKVLQYRMSLKEISESDVNVSLMSILEDALKQNITDLSEIMKAFIAFLEDCKTKYRFLFKKHAHYKLMEALISGDTSENQELLRKRIEEIDLKAERLFGKFNSKDMPSEANFTRLKGKVGNIRQVAKKYRDEIAAHDGKTQPSVQWDELDNAIDEFRVVVTDFYTILSFEMEFGDVVGPGFLKDETEAILIEQVYYKKHSG